MGQYLKKKKKKKKLVNAILKITYLQFKKVLYGVVDKVFLSTSGVISMGLRSRSLNVYTFKDVNRAGSKLSRGFNNLHVNCVESKQRGMLMFCQLQVKWNKKENRIPKEKMYPLIASS